MKLFSTCPVLSLQVTALFTLHKASHCDGSQFETIWDRSGWHCKTLPRASQFLQKFLTALLALVALVQPIQKHIQRHILVYHWVQPLHTLSCLFEVARHQGCTKAQIALDFQSRVLLTLWAGGQSPMYTVALSISPRHPNWWTMCSLILHSQPLNLKIKSVDERIGPSYLHKLAKVGAGRGSFLRARPAWVPPDVENAEYWWHVITKRAKKGYSKNPEEFEQHVFMFWSPNEHN